MQSYTLQPRAGLMFLEHGGLWLIDTGAPSSFGASESIELDGARFEFRRSLMGYTADQISELVGFEIAGLLGNDVLGELDWQFDLPAGRVRASAELLSVAGSAIPLNNFLGTPILEAEVAGRPCRLLLDTGAELSYFPAEFFRGLVPNGQFRDFNPVMGWADVNLYSLEARIAGLPFRLRCAPIPEQYGLLKMACRMLSTEGLVGNQIFQAHPVLYSPRRNILAFGVG